MIFSGMFSRNDYRNATKNDWWRYLALQKIIFLIVHSAYLEDERHDKLKPIESKHILLGYRGVKRYRLWCKATRRIVTSRHAIFNKRSLLKVEPLKVMTLEGRKIAKHIWNHQIVSIFGEILVFPMIPWLMRRLQRFRL